ncbi:hypothetical protein BV22DRAFT_1101099, partial [Leucogyrophana mollusca]
PPDSRGLPFISNVLNVDAARPWPAYNAWAEIYGQYGIVYSSIFSQQFVDVGSVGVASELFGQRSSIYSNRIDTVLHILFSVSFVVEFLTNERRPSKVFPSYLAPINNGKAQRHIPAGVPGVYGRYWRTGGFSAALIVAVPHGYKATTRDGPLIGRVQEFASIPAIE